MRAKIIQMRDMGIPRPRRQISDAAEAPGDFVELSITDTRENFLRRFSKVASYKYGERDEFRSELYDVQIVWIEGNRMMLSGMQRCATTQGPMDVVQSWLCVLG